MAIWISPSTIHVRQQLVAFDTSTRLCARMPSRDRFLMPLTLEQFFSAVLLRIFPIQNLEPSAVLSLRDVRAELVLRNDALQIQFANSLKLRLCRNPLSSTLSSREADFLSL